MKREQSIRQLGRALCALNFWIDVVLCRRNAKASGGARVVEFEPGQIFMRVYKKFPSFERQIMRIFLYS